MTTSQKLELRASEIRQRLNEISGLVELTDEVRAESDKLATEYADVETRRRAAIIAEGEVETRETATVDAEHRERIELRGRARLGSYLLAAMQGRLPAGAEAEYASACGVDSGIPLDPWEVDRPVETRAAVEHRGADAVSPAPTTGQGSTLHPVQPYVFDQSIVGRLGISMPSVTSGSHSWAPTPTPTPTPTTAAAKAKGGAAESTAAALTPVTASPRRISARLSIEAEDVAQIGTANFESALRSNLSSALADQYDHQCILGDGQSPSVNGLLAQLIAPAVPSDVADFYGFLAAVAAAVDGTWAGSLRDVVTIVNPETFRLSATSFRDATNHKGSEAASSYLGRETGGWTTAARMPDTPTTGNRAKVADAILRRTGRSLLACVHPVWGSLSVDDIFTDSASARRHFTMHVLVGDRVLLVQPAAYVRGAFKVKA